MPVDEDLSWRPNLLIVQNTAGPQCGYSQNGVQSLEDSNSRHLVPCAPSEDRPHVIMILQAHGRFLPLTAIPGEVTHIKATGKPAIGDGGKCGYPNPASCPWRQSGRLVEYFSNISSFGTDPDRHRY